jgi:hypothetical protein
LKANMDAGWDAHSRDVGTDIIVRDCQGSVVLSEWKFVKGFRNIVNQKISYECERESQDLI